MAISCKSALDKWQIRGAGIELYPNGVSPTTSFGHKHQEQTLNILCDLVSFSRILSILQKSVFVLSEGEVPFIH